MELFEYALVAGVLYGVFYSLVAIGLNVVFGVLRMINLAHGQFVVLGGFGAYILSQDLNVNPIFGIPLAAIGAALIGYPLYRIAVVRLNRSRDPQMMSLIVFFGLGQVIEACAILAFGVDERSLPADLLGSGSFSIFGQSFPASWWIAAVASVVAILALHVYLTRTRLGLTTRAMMDDREEASRPVATALG